MPDSAEPGWFPQHFQARIQPPLAGTPLTVDFIVAMACEETGHSGSLQTAANQGVMGPSQRVANRTAAQATSA